MNASEVICRLPPTALQSGQKVMTYYDLRRNWTERIVPHLGDKQLNDILRRDFEKYTIGRWRRQRCPSRYPVLIALVLEARSASERATLTEGASWLRQTIRFDPGSKSL